MTRSSTLRVACALLTLCVASTAPAAVDDLLDVVPAGAPLVVYVADVQQTIDRMTASSLADLWNDPQVKAFFAPVREDLEVDRWDELALQHTGFSTDQLKEMLTGDLVVYLPSADLSLDDAGAEDIELVLLVSVGKNASTIEQLILRQERRLDEDGGGSSEEADTTKRHEVRDFRDVEIHVETTVTADQLVDETAWAVVDGVLAVASPAAILERAVGDILDGGTDTFIGSADNFRTISKHTAGTDAWLYFNIEPWVPMVRAAMEAGMTAAQESGSPFPLNAATTADALALDAMQAFFATMSFPGRTMVSEFGLTYTGNRGLIKLIAYGKEKAPRPDYIPATVDAFGTGQFDFVEAWSALVEIINGINPSLMGLATIQLQGSVEGVGAELDLRRDLLDNLTGEVVSIQNLEGITGDSVSNLELAQDQVIVLGIKKREALENVMATLKTLVGQGSELFTQRDFEGHTVFTLNVPQAEGESNGQQVAYAITDGLFLVSVGSPATLEQVLRQIASDADSAWTRRDVRSALGQLPDGAAALQFQDVARAGHLLFKAVAALSMTGSGDDDRPFCDPSAVPDPEVVGRYLSSAVSGAWKNDREIVIRALLLPAEPK